MLVVHPSLPVKSVKELIDYCKGKQGQPWLPLARARRATSPEPTLAGR